MTSLVSMCRTTTISSRGICNVEVCFSHVSVLALGLGLGLRLGLG